MSARSDLIFDVGVCNGDDSAYYLHKGYRVVGIEANPLLIPELSERFATEIRAGLYTLVPVGIAEAEGEATFWICDDLAEWSSFDRSVAGRNGARHHGVPVRTCRFGTLVEQYGMPAFCKIDIEGNDDLCLADLSADAKPRYLSIEVIHGDDQIRQLQALGYTRFKLISQRTLRPPMRALAELKAAIPRWLRKQIIRSEVLLSRRGPDDGWRFTRGSSGPFGESTPGPWLDADEALELVRLIDLPDEYSEWHDIHAAE